MVDTQPSGGALRPDFSFTSVLRFKLECIAMPLSLFGSSEKEKKPGLFERLKQAVASTKAQLVERLEEIVEGKQTVDQSVLDDLEATLLTADLE